MGDVPDWYITVRAAKYLGVAPWELLDRPVIWTSWALEASNAEDSARKQKEQRESRKK